MSLNLIPTTSQKIGSNLEEIRGIPGKFRCKPDFQNLYLPLSQRGPGSAHSQLNI